MSDKRRRPQHPSSHHSSISARSSSLQSGPGETPSCGGATAVINPASRSGCTDPNLASSRTSKGRQRTNSSPTSKLLPLLQTQGGHSPSFLVNRLSGISGSKSVYLLAPPSAQPGRCNSHVRKFHPILPRTNLERRD